MAYTQKTWKNRQSEHPNRRVLTPTGNPDEYDVVRSEGVVAEEGDLLDADNLNDLESRIKAGFAATAETDTGIQLYTHSSGTLSGNGTNGRVKATATATYSRFTIGGVAYSVRAGEDTSVDFMSGVWYTFVLDAQAKTINFKRGGGVSSKMLGQATATTADVRKGKTFFAGDKTLKTGDGGVGATGSFTSKYNETVSVNVGFQPEKIVLSYQYDGGDTHIWLEFNADSPDVFTVHTSKGYNDTAISNAIGTTGAPASGYGYIKATETGFDFMGYFTSSGNREIRYVCY